MKIGIMTFCTSVDNYGQMMQCFALQKYLRINGYDAYVIKYHQPKIVNPAWLRALHALNPVTTFKYFNRVFSRAVSNKENKAFPRHFDDFLGRYVVFSSVSYNDPQELKVNPPEADVYIVGSDQVWGERASNSERQREIIDVYFLNFGGENVRRLSYAASWGRSEISDSFAKVITPLLEKFSAVSVREKTGLDICRKLGFENVKWVCDPTFLLNAEEYRRIYRENSVRKHKGKYIFLYYLGNKTDFDVKTVYDFAKRKGFEVVYVSENAQIDKYEKFFATIPEWLCLIDNADYVVTNSFHGAVFSTLFNKRYGVVPCTGKAALMNTRIDSLFEMSNIEPRWLKPGEGFSILDRPYSADISSFRAESIRFLTDALKNIRER